MFILQAEGTEVSAELEFLNQQNLILNMENKALKQRLESLAQEHLIKYCKYLLLAIYILIICCFISLVKLKIGLNYFQVVV